MKKILCAFLACVLTLTMSACRQNTSSEKTNSKVLVVYYSASGTTKSVAQKIANSTNGELFEITPKNPYSEEDLDWTQDNSRVNQEHEDVSLQDVELVSTKVKNWKSYDTVFIGYPIWWGIAAWPMNHFVKENDFSDKTIIPFCTSASSGLGNSAKNLEEMTHSGNWQEGKRFSSGTSQSQIDDWVDSLDLK